MIIESIQETSDQIRPIQFLTIGTRTQVPAPLIRITTCGLLTIEVVEEIVSTDPPLARYATLTPEQLRGRGTAPALILLKLLLSRPERFALKDWLMEAFCRDQELFSNIRLDNIVSQLRGVLCPPPYENLRTHLVTHLRSSPGSGYGYQLAAYPLIWVDSDALIRNGEQAARLERFGDDSLPYWEHTYTLAKRGIYLPDEIYTPWSTTRREAVAGILRQSVQALARLYLARHGAAGEEEALLLLRSYWLENPREEDALRQFMELLGRREQYHEALEDYKRLVTLLEQEEYQPDKQTQDLAEYLQLKQIQRPSVAQTLLLPSRSEAELDIVEAEGVVLVSSNTSHPLFLSERTEQKNTTGVQQSFLDKGKVPSLEHFYGRGQELVEQPRDDEMHFPQFWNVPHLRNPFFTGREELLAHIYAIFLTEKTAIAVTQHALCGLGGIGKTQVALEYAYRYRHKYNAVFWIKADTRNNLLADFLSLATLLQLPERAAKDHSITIAAIKQWMRVNNAWLFILDNVDDLSLTREFLPTGHQGHILLTTRAQALGGLAYHIDVEEMTQETGALFLLRRIGQLGPNASPPDATHAQYQLAKNLVQELGGLPLALDQAGAYIEETSFGFQEYLHAYRAHRHVLLQRRGGFTTDHPEPVATTWSLSLDLVQQSDPIAVDFLRICAFLDPDVIPEEILSEGLAEFIAPHASNQANQIRFNEILSVLLRFSLIRRNMETRTITIHRLVQAMIQDTMKKEVQGQWAKRAVQAVQRTFPQPSIIYSAAGHPHSAIQLLSASVYLYREQNDTGQLAETLWKLAVQQQVIGHLRDAERNLFEGLSLCQGIGDWFNGAKTHQYFALLRMYQGLFPEALSHLDKALALFQTKESTKAESTIYAYYALYYLHAHQVVPSHDAACKAHALAKENGDERDIIRSKWLLGWVCTQHSLQNTVEKKWLLEAEIHLNEALQRCRQSGMIDYEADILLAWARFSDRNGDDQQAEKYAKEAFALTKKSAFDLLQADVCIFLAHLELKHGNYSMAQTYVSLARRYAYCDGFPYYYKAAVTEAERLLLDLNTLYTNNV